VLPITNEVREVDENEVSPMDLTEFGINRDPVSRFVLANAAPPIEVNEVPRTSEVLLVFTKAKGPIDNTEELINRVEVMGVYANAIYPIEVTEVPSTSEVICVL